MNTSPTSRPRPSLTWWIFALALVPMLGAAGWAFLAVSRHPENASDREAAAALLRVAPAVDQALETQGEQLARLGAVIARDPKFYAVLTLPGASRASAEYREALDAVLRDYQREADVPVFAVTDPRGKLLGRAAEPGVGAVDPSDAPFVRAAVRGKPGSGYIVEREQIYRVATVPITAGGVLVGTLTLGRQVDGELGGRLKTALEADVTLTVERDIAATTLVPSPLRKALAERLSERMPRAEKGADAPVVAAGGRRYLALRREISGDVVGGASLGYVLTRPLGSDASPLAKLEADLVRAAGVGIALALICGGVVALAVRRHREALGRAHADEMEVWSERDRARSALLATVGRRVLDQTQTVYTITDLVADGALGELSGPQREGMLAIRVASRRLTRLGQDLSVMASLERGDPAPARSSVDVGNLMEEVATQLIPVASERRQMVELSVEPGLVHPDMDPDLLTRVVEGLALHLVERGPSASKVVLEGRRTSGGIELLIAGARPEAEDGGTAGDPGDAEVGEEVSPTMARIFAARNEGTFEVLTGEGLAFRVWLPVLPGVPVTPEPIHSEESRAVGPAASSAVSSVDGPTVAVESPGGAYAASEASAPVEPPKLVPDPGRHDPSDPARAA